MSTYITLQEAKTHLRVDFTDDDTYIQSLCDLVEAVVLNEIKGTKTGEGTVTTNATTSLVGSGTNFLDFQAGDTICVDGQSNVLISTITDDEHLTVATAYTSNSDSLSYEVISSLPLEGTDIPLQLKHAMLLLIGHFYMSRETSLIGVNQIKIPYGFEFLIAPYKNYTIR